VGRGGKRRLEKLTVQFAAKKMANVFMRKDVCEERKRQQEQEKEK